MKTWVFREEDAPRVEEMFLGLYEHQIHQGPYYPLKPGGPALWMKQMRPLLGQYAMIFCGGDDEKLAQAFLALRVKTYPAYLDRAPSISIAECFVDPGLRGKGMGKALFQKAMDWGKEKGLLSLELQTTVGNQGAESFWEHLGFKKELTQWSLKS